MLTVVNMEVINVAKELVKGCIACNVLVNASFMLFTLFTIGTVNDVDILLATEVDRVVNPIIVLFIIVNKSPVIDWANGVLNTSNILPNDWYNEDRLIFMLDKLLNICSKLLTI